MTGKCCTCRHGRIPVPLLNPTTAHLTTYLLCKHALAGSPPDHLMTILLPLRGFMRVWLSSAPW